jgi:hypothetical protein
MTPGMYGIYITYSLATLTPTVPTQVFRIRIGFSADPDPVLWS